MKKRFWKTFFENTYLFLIFLFMYLPVMFLMLFSFNTDKTITKWGGFSFKWYKEMMSNDELLEAVFNTVSIGLLAAVISCVIGTAAAIGIQAYKNSKIKSLINNITNLPMISSELVMGASLLILFTIADIDRGYITILISHITFCIPYVIVSVLPKLMQLDNGLYEAALDLGAKPFYAFRKVIIPEIRPGIVNGLLISFTLSIDDFVISDMTKGNGVNNISTLINTTKRINPMYNALSTVLFVLIALILLFINRRSSRKNDEPISFFG